MDQFYGKNQRVLNFYVIHDILNNKDIQSFISSRPEPKLLLSFLTFSERQLLMVNSPGMLFAYSCKDVEFLSKMLTLKEGIKFIVYVQNCELTAIEELIARNVNDKPFSFIRGYLMLFQYFLIDTKTFVQLVSLEWFTEDECDSPQLKVINIYNKTENKWNKKLENHEKYQNFHGCTLIMKVDSAYSQTCWGGIYINNDIMPVAYGLTPMIFNFVAKKYNFKPFICRNTDKFCYPDFLLSLGTMNSLKIPENMLLVPIFMENHDLVFVERIDYILFDKLLQPFDSVMWVLIVAGIFAGFCVILATNRIFQAVQSVLNGTATKVKIFTGIFEVPQMSFARVVVTFILLFCLIFRIWYQNEMFAHFTMHKYPEQPKTLNELRNKNYKILTDLSKENLKNYYGNALKDR